MAEFLDNRRAIGLLAVALVAVTAFVVGGVLQALVPGLPLDRGGAIGAAVAPPDPVAATAIAQQAASAASATHHSRGRGPVERRDGPGAVRSGGRGGDDGSVLAGEGRVQLALATVVGVLVGFAVALVARWLLTSCLRIRREARSGWSRRSSPMSHPMRRMERCGWRW